MRNAPRLGLVAAPGSVDSAQLAIRISTIAGDINRSWEGLLKSQGVEIITGKAKLTGPNEALIDDTVRVRFDRCLLSTGSNPRVPDWAPVDGRRVLITRDVYDLPDVPEKLVVIGSGVTGVEFVHIFESLGSEVSLVVSRQQILPHRDPEVAAVLEENFLERGVRLVLGARAVGIDASPEGVKVRCDDDRVVEGTHALLAIGSIPNTAGLGLEEVGIDNDGGFIKVDENQQTSVPHIYAAGDCTGQMLLSSVAAMKAGFWPSARSPSSACHRLAPASPWKLCCTATDRICMMRASVLSSSAMPR